RPSAILASSTNIATNWRLRAYAVWIFLITSVLLRPCATVVRARNTSAMPPVPILRIREYLPNCSMPRATLGTRSAAGVADRVRPFYQVWSGSQRRDREVVEPGIGLPVVEAEVLVAGAVERLWILVAQERLLQVVDEPRDGAAAPLDPPVVVLVGDD